MQSTCRIYLVGPMGAGKSTVGRALAAQLGWTFVDSDHEVEQRTGADIPWIFEIEGEAGFRDREAQMIEELTQRDNVVLATGGGAIMREESRTYLKSRGFVVYLAANVREQVRRTGKDSKRPLLAGKDRKAVLSDLMAERDPLYRQVSHVTLATENRSAKKLAQLIEEAFSLWQESLHGTASDF
jgi:shikimate kinase